MSSHASAASRTTSRWASLACPSTDYLPSQPVLCSLHQPITEEVLYHALSSTKAAYAAGAPSVPMPPPPPHESPLPWILTARFTHSLPRAFALPLTRSFSATTVPPSRPHSLDPHRALRTIHPHPSTPPRPHPQRRQVLALQPPRRQRRRGRRELSLLHDRPQRHAMRRARQALQAALRHLGAPLEVPRVPPPRRHRRPH